MLANSTSNLIQPVQHYLNQTILNPLGWEDFTLCLNAYLTRRRGQRVMYVDLFPTLACLAAGGAPEQAIPVTSGWLLFILAARIFDDLSDGQQLAQEWHNADSQTTLAMALFALGAANSAVTQIPSGEISKEVSRTFNQALALAAKMQHDPTNASCPSVEKYLASIAAKTGLIFAAGAWSGGVVASDTPCQKTLSALYNYGLNVGIMDQIVDDCQDLTSDLAQGVWTLPVIYALAKVSGREHRNLLSTLQQAKGGDAKAVETAVSHIASYDSIPWCLTAAAAHQQRALKSLETLPHKNTLHLVAYAQQKPPIPFV